MLWLWLMGCAYVVQLESRPDGAVVRLPSGRVTSTPETLKIRPYSPKAYWVEVSLPGYRPARVDLRKDLATEWRFFGKSVLHFTPKVKARFEVVLIPEHPPAGAWDPAAEGLSDG